MTINGSGLMLCLLLIPALIMGQKQGSFIQLVNQANHYLTEYAKLSAMEEKIPASAIELSAKEKEEIIKASSAEFIHHSASDSIDSHLALEYLQRKIMTIINGIFHHPDFSKHDIQQLIKSDDCIIIKSDDNKLFNFSLDEKTGGTYRSRLSIVYFVDFLLKDIAQEEEFQSFFDPDGYDSIYTLPTEEGVKYLLKSSVRGCSLCFRNSIEVIHFTENQIVHEFEYTQESRDWNDGIYYDRLSKTIHVKYHLDDLSPECDCGKVNTIETVVENGNSVSPEKTMESTCTCLFVFNGKTFESAGK